MNFLFIFLIFGSFYTNANLSVLQEDIDVQRHNREVPSNASENESDRSPDSSVKWYNQGVHHYNSQEKIKAIAYFRKALHSDPWLWPAQKALHQLQYPPPFWMLIPSELFLCLIGVSLLLMFFSMSMGRIVFFFLCLVFYFSFSFYRRIPRFTIFEETQAHTAPHASSSVLFSLAPGDWIIQRKVEKEWVQIKTPEQTIGWILKIKLQEK